MVATDLYGLVLGFGVASLGFGFTRPGFTGGASLAVPLAEQGGVAGVITAANGIAYVAAPTVGMALYAIDPHWPFAVSAALARRRWCCGGSARCAPPRSRLRLARLGRPAASPLAGARGWSMPGRDEADPAGRPHRVGLQRVLDALIIGEHVVGHRGAGLDQARPRNRPSSLRRCRARGAARSARRGA